MWRNFGIVEVKEDFRGQGVGRKLVEYALNIHGEAGTLSIGIECTPETSIPFWKHMGFRCSYGNRYYYLLEKQCDIPQPSVPINVEINVYPHDKQWEAETQPVQTYHPKAFKCSDEIIYLEERISIYKNLSIWNKDPLIGIKINGKEVHLSKAKSQSSNKIGVLCDKGAFSIEKIREKNLVVR